MTKVDPGLLHVVARRLRRARAAAEATARAPDLAHVAVEFSGVIDDLRAAGFEPLGRVRDALGGGRIAAGRIPFEHLGRLEAIEHVMRIEGSAPLQPALNHSVHAIQADAVHAAPYGLTGAGVLIGIIDMGIDWQHQDLRRADGTSRILGIWDQSLTPLPGSGETAPAAFPNIGVEYTNGQINLDLANDNCVEDDNCVVRTTDKRKLVGGHGTHVAGIAAGDGSANGRVWGSPGTHVGVAPDADLVVVVLPDPAGFSAVGYETNLAHAFDFIWDYFTHHPQLPPRPIVINVSAGFRMGPHDGHTLIEEAITADLAGTTGRAVVVAAGNDRKSGSHARVEVHPGTPVRLKFTVPWPADWDVFLQLWFDANREVRCSVTAPNGEASGDVGPGDSDETELVDSAVVMHLSSHTAPNGRCIALTLDRSEANDAKVPSGDWYVDLENTGTADVTIDAWIGAGSPKPQDDLWFPGTATRYGTIRQPGTCEAVITVGAYAPGDQPNRNAFGDLADFSSLGPTRDLRDKPDLVAPGVGITAASPDGWPTSWEPWVPRWCKDGTSAAAPHVAGVIALMFQANPGLSPDQVKQILRATATAPPDILPDDEKLVTWGAGSINALEAVRAVPLPPPPPSGSPL